MKKSLKLKVVLGWILFLGLTPSVLQAETTSVVREGVPFPFSVSNRFVELADGCYYELIGRIVFKDGRAWLRIDFDRHPWLRNPVRKSFPFYPLVKVSSMDWSSYEGMVVKIAVKAIVDTTVDEDLGVQSLIWLEPQLFPKHYDFPDYRDVPSSSAPALVNK